MKPSRRNRRAPRLTNRIRCSSICATRASASATAKEMGLDNVRHIAGGFGAWRKAELPVETLVKKSGQRGYW